MKGTTEGGGRAAGKPVSYTHLDVYKRQDVKGDVVNVGLKVTVKDLDTGEKETFAIVGATESDPFNGKISTDSSVGKTCLLYTSRCV